MEQKVEAPKDYEDLIRVIHDRYDGMSKSYQTIALYLTQNPNDVAVRSVNSIGESSGVHASSFVRFAQALGYEGFKDLQSLFQKRLSTAAPGFEARVKALEKELGERTDRSEMGFMHDLVVRDIASLQEMLTDIQPEDLAEAVSLLREGRRRLSDRTASLGAGGRTPSLYPDHAGQALRAPGSGRRAGHAYGPRDADDDLLFAVSFRFYANEVVNVVEEAAGRGIPIVAISDSTLSPLAKSARVLFAVPEHEYTFSRSLAAPMCLAQALTVALAARLQNNAINPRIPTVTER